MIVPVLYAAGVCGAPAPVQSAAAPRVLRVENAGLLFTDNQSGVSGTDAGYSLPIGRDVLWIFGDCFLLHPTAPERRYVGGVSNAGLLLRAGRGRSPLRNYRFITDPVTHLAREIVERVPDEGNDVRIWPQGGWFDPTLRRAYLTYATIRTHGPGPFDFKDIGHGMSVADIADPDRLLFRRLPGPSGSRLWWPSGGGAATYGQAVASTAPGGWVYIVGIAEGQGEKSARLARVRTDRIGELAAYEYLVAATPSPHWSSDPSRAGIVEGLTGFSEASIAYNRYLGGWLAVHSVGLDQKVRLCLAPEPWGPYRTIAEIGAPHQAFANAFCYAGKEHPELAEQGGKVIYITYVDNQRYWLQLLRVTLER
jgi:hypothetical protein